MLLYIYDIKHENKRNFNKIKRVFYYNLGKLGLKNTTKITKSTILVPDTYERIMDNFFSNFKKKTKNIIIFKVFAHSVEEIEY